MNTSCQGIDWAPGNPSGQQCFLLSTTNGKNPNINGVTHFDYLCIGGTTTAYLLSLFHCPQGRISHMAKRAEAHGPRILRAPKIVLNIFSDSYYCCKSRFFASEGGQQQRPVNEEQRRRGMPEKNSLLSHSKLPS